MALSKVDTREETMNKKIKILILACALVVLCLFLVSCSEKDAYDQLDEEGYTLTVQYDPNGLNWEGNTDYKQLTDSYNVSKLELNENGKYEIQLIKPNDPRRGEANMYTLTLPDDQIFVGWFTEREEVIIDGELAGYSYSGYWSEDDFAKRKYTIDPSEIKSTSNEPTVTLYAVTSTEKPTVEIYDIDDPEKLLCVYELDGVSSIYKNLQLPEWDKGTGTIAYKTFNLFKNSLNLKGKTLDGIYLDKEGTQKIEGTYVHPVTVNDDTSMSNTELKLYFDYKDGEWYRIYSASQLKKNAKSNGYYEIMADIEKFGAWPSKFMENDFTGKIIGNGHTISDITLSTDIGEISPYYFGMFKTISKDAEIKDVTFKSIEATIDEIDIKPGARYALFAGAIEDGFVFENVKIEESKLKIDTFNVENAFSTVAEYEIALLCAEGYHDGLGLDASGIIAEAIDNEYSYTTLTIEKDADENRLILTFVEKPSTEEQ